MAGNFANLGMFDSRNKLDLLDSVSETIFKASKDNATIMTQSMSFQICNTDIPYERYTWANLGAFSNYLLNKKNSIRSNHPFASYTALGKNAYICDTSTPFAYGIKSPYDNMLKFDNIKMFSVGMPPNTTCSTGASAGRYPPTSTAPPSCGTPSTRCPSATGTPPMRTLLPRASSPTR